MPAKPPPPPVFSFNESQGEYLVMIQITRLEEGGATNEEISTYTYAREYSARWKLMFLMKKYNAIDKYNEPTRFIARREGMVIFVSMHKLSRKLVRNYEQL